MREILFRGKRLDNGEWVEGSLHIERGETDKNGNSSLDYRILGMRGECDYVDPTTVGQFTGLMDRNGNRIFEGDVFQDEDLTGVVKFIGGNFLLEWSGRKGQWTENGFDECGGEYGVVECEHIDFYYVHNMEVIGNIHDPELLEVTPDE